MGFFKYKSLIAIAAAASLASLPSAAAWTDGISAPPTAHPGENIAVTIGTSIYVQNNDEFGIVWGLATPQTASYPGLVGTQIGYTDLKGPTAPEVPANGNYSVQVSIPAATQQGDLVLVAGIPTLVGASGSTLVRFFYANVTIAA